MSKRSASAIGSFFTSLKLKTEDNMPEAVKEELMFSTPGKTDSATTTYFAKHGNVYTITPDPTMDLHKRLPAGNYVVKVHPQIGFFLEQTDSFDIPKVIYGNTEAQASRILSTFKDRKHTTGVLLVGEQGSGKTLLAKMLSAKAAQEGMPTIIINAPFVGSEFNTFLASIHQPVLVLFDEFEKVYDNDHQPHLLTMLDGVYGGKKLYVMTANDKYKIDTHLKNRPGRFYYFMEFKGVTREFVVEYCNRNLKDPKKLEDILGISGMFPQMNFDMLQALVEEVNRYNETPLQAIEFLNVKPVLEFRETYVSVLVVDGKEIPVEHMMEADGTWYGNPFDGNKFTVPYWQEKLAEDGTDSGKWIKPMFSIKNIKKYDAQKGIMVLENEKGVKLTLTKQTTSTEFNYRDLMAL